MADTPTSRTLRFFAAGQPKGQPRPRAFSRGGSARVYDPGTAEGWKSCIVLAGKSERPRQPLTTPLYVFLDFLMPRPKGHYRTGKNAGKIKDGSPYHHTGKPDADNLAKAVLDAMTQDGWWTDDALVVRLGVSKRYTDPGERSGVWIQVEAANTPPVELIDYEAA